VTAASHLEVPAIPGYEDIRLIGQGGMGAVYRARQSRLARIVAIKMLSRQMASSAGFIARFEREAQIVAHLSHPNILAVYDFGEYQDQGYMILEYAEGGTLARRMREQSFTPRQIAEMMEQLSSAVDYAHKRGVLHRDIKPANVLIGEGDILKIADFGIARLEVADVRLTQTGVILGTPAYMSPEQLLGNEVDGRSDIYALGTMMYELLTGTLPHQGDNAYAIMHAKVSGDTPPAPRSIHPEIPIELEAICLKCLRTSPDDRYHSAHDLAEALGQFLNPAPPPEKGGGEKGGGWMKRLLGW
jgi:eukaryotic-like serine/threonine-protein kinase